MKTKTAGPKIIFALFLAVICFGMVWLLLPRGADTRDGENREPRPLPEVKTQEDYENLPADMEGYLDDRMPLRNELVTVNNALDYYLFGNVRSEKAVVGKDGWVFYSNVLDGDPIACYQGTNLRTEEELKAFADHAVRVRDTLAERGCEFVLFIAPDKERIYPEYMPDRYGQPAEMYRALQAVAYLRENTDVRVVYPCEELMAAKALFREELYYKRDTHWNAIGGYIGSRALLQELGIGLPPPSEISVTYAGEKSGDLARTLGLRPVLKSADYRVEGYDSHGAECVTDEDDVYEYRAENADPRKFYAVRDSFFVNMVPYVQSQFNESHTKFYKFYSYEDFEPRHPDIFVYECVARYLDGFQDFNVGDGG